MHIALCFWGITRSTDLIIDSIKENILDILKKHNIEYDIYVHTFTLNHYINNRTKENVKNYDNTKHKLLNAKYLEMEDQDMIKKRINMLQYRTHKEVPLWNVNNISQYNTTDNYILAEYSKSKLVKMIENSKKQYDAIIYLRPDCYYLTKFNINFLRFINNKTICIPQFMCAKNGENDRFCITNMNTYKFYGSIFYKLLNISKKRSLHSEKILKQIIQTEKLVVKRISFNFVRVRINGEIADRDKKKGSNVERERMKRNIKKKMAAR